MPKIEFAEGFKKSNKYDFNKLSLEQGERARISVIESPTVEYVHALQRVIMDQGKPVMTTQTFGKNMERTREVPEKDYVGRFLCLGDFEILEKHGVDSDNCPACKASTETMAVDKPTRRFALHVLKYQVKKGSFNIQEPFQVALQVWDFTGNRYDALTDINSEHGALSNLDLNLGPCENKMYQKYTFTAAANCEWQKSPERKKIVAEVIKSQKVEDLSIVLGRKVNFAELASQVQDVVGTWNIAFGTPGSVPTANKAEEAELNLDFGAPAAEEKKEDDPWATPKDDEPKSDKKPGNIESLEDLLGSI